MNNLIEFLEWDSSFFCHRIARITPTVLTNEMWKEINHWLHVHNVECVYFLADVNDLQTLRMAEKVGFFLTDIRITLENRAFNNDPEKPVGIRPYRSSDLEYLRPIARISHHDSRFYYDEHFSKDQCDSLYDIWINKSCNGYADEVLVADIDGIAVGYITLHYDETEGRIGLLGVDPAYQGRSLGKRMLVASLNSFAAKGYQTVSVVTQGRNLRAQRLYQTAGFKIRLLQLWYHGWLKPAISKE